MLSSISFLTLPYLDCPSPHSRMYLPQSSPFPTGSNVPKPPPQSCYKQNSASPHWGPPPVIHRNGEPHVTHNLRLYSMSELVSSYRPSECWKNSQWDPNRWSPYHVPCSDSPCHLFTPWKGIIPSDWQTDWGLTNQIHSQSADFLT